MSIHIKLKAHREGTLRWWHPQIRAARVKNDSELLRRGSNGYFTVVLSIQVILQCNNIGFLSVNQVVLEMIFSNGSSERLSSIFGSNSCSKPVVWVQFNLFQSNPTHSITWCTEHDRKQQGWHKQTQPNRMQLVPHVLLFNQIEF